MDSDLEPVTDNGHTPSTAFLPLNHDQRCNTNSSVPVGLDNLANLMEQQVELLRRIDQRQAAADLSTQPIPQVPATSSSTWGALLRSRVSETIQPKVDRWRSGLDALLVFVSRNLDISFISITEPPKLGSAPEPFQPDALNVRLNSYWSLSLILSLSVAALAVACHGYLNMVTLSTHRRAVDKLIESTTAGNPLKKCLALRSNHPLRRGLLDSIFSNILSLELLPIPIAAASSLSLFFIAGVVGFLAFALLHASVYPDSSPFQSTLVRVVRKIFPAPKNYSDPKRILLNTYHEIVQATHEDETLDSAAAALVATINRATNSLLAVFHAGLLQPWVIIILKPSLADPEQPGFHLLDDLAQAARRSANSRPLRTLWNSAYIQAWAVMVGVFREDHPPVICLLGSSYTLSYANILPMGHFHQTLLAFSSQISLWHEMLFTITFISLLMAAKTPAVVIAAAHDRLTQPDSFSRYSDPFVTGLLVLEASLGLPDSSLGAENHLLAELCSACIWYAKEQVESGYPAGFYEDVLEMTERVKERFPPSPTSPVVSGDALITKARAFILRSIDLGTEYTAQESVTS
ncbi:hypothetical protein B0H13DRAFT_2352544 [Mycena leptocephala]|nr:hypothetical protein B0H13DRAFT_2352544 [Mycena leptocephala]